MSTLISQAAFGRWVGWLAVGCLGHESLIVIGRYSFNYRVNGKFPNDQTMEIRHFPYPLIA